MAKLFFIVGTAIVFAAVGSVGSNGQVPYLTMSSKYINDTITVTLHDAPEDHGSIIYICSLSDGFIDCTDIIGPGGQILEDDYFIVVTTDETSFQVIPRDKWKDVQVYIQAIIRDENAPTPTGVDYVVSRPLSVTLSEKYDLSQMEVSWESFVPHAGEITDVEIHGDYLYCASKQFGLVRLARSQEGSPVWSGALKDCHLGFSPEHVAVGSDRAVLTGENKMIGVVDLSNTSIDPTLIGEFSLDGFDFYGGIVRQAGADVYAYMNTFKNGLVVLNVTTASSFGMVNQLVSGEWVKDVKEYMGYLYVITVSKNGYVYDLSGGAYPMLVASFTLPGAPANIAFDGNKAYVLAYIGTEVYVYDLPSAYTGGTAPQLASVESCGSTWFTNMALDQGRVYLFNQNTLQPYLIETDGAFTPMSPLTFTKEITDLSIDGDMIHLSKAENSRGVESVSTASFQAVPKPDYCLKHKYLNDLAVVEAEVGGTPVKLCYVLERDVGFRVVDVSDPEKPLLVQTIAGKYLSLAAFKDKLIYSFDDKVIRVCSIESLEGDLETICEFNAQHRANSLCVSNDCVYVADCLEGLSIYDLQDLAYPKHLSTFNDPAWGPVLSVSVSGYFAYVVSTAGTAVVNVSDRTQPEQVGFLGGYGGTAFHCASDGFCLLLPDMINGLQVFDVSSPFAQVGPYFVNTFVFPNYASDAAIEGNLAVASMKYGGDLYWKKYVYFYDITCPSQTSCVKSFNLLPGFNDAVELNDGYIYVTDEESLLDILSIK